MLKFTMKLVVAGMSGAALRRMSRSAVNRDSSSSEQNRRQSSRWVGLGAAPVVRGGRISSQSWYHWLQKVVPQAWFSASRSSAYFARSQRRKAAALSSQ